MNEQTAKHLNHLLRKTDAVQLSVNGLAFVRRNDPTHWADNDIIVPLNVIYLEILRNIYPVALAQEIRTAAAAKRRVCAGDKKRPLHDWLDSAAQILAVEMARPQIEAVIAADNARRLAEYEAYRAACEQGVAVPPVKEDYE